MKDSLKTIIIGSILFFACTRGSDEVNKTVRPESQQFTTTFADTFTVKTATILFDSSISNNSSRTLIGSYYNPDFGKITSNAYFQFLPNENKISLGPNPKFDSLYLELYFSHSLKNPRKTPYTFGLIDEVQNFNVRKLDEIIFSNVLYFNNSSFLSSNLLGSFQLSKNKLLVITPNTTSGAVLNYIKIPLSDVLGQEFVDASNDLTFASPANFLEKFKGVLIENTNGNSCIWGIDSALVKLKYHNFYAANNLKINEEYVFNLSSIRTRVQNITADRSGTPLANLVNNYDEKISDFCYVQASTGVCTKVSFPYLLDFKKQIGVDKLVINRAELEITPDLSNAAYPVPTNLYFYEFDENGRSIRNADGLPTIRTAFSEGELSVSQNYYLTYFKDKNTYIVKKFDSDEVAISSQLAKGDIQVANVTRFVQSILDGKTKPNKSLVLASDGGVFFRPISANNRNVELYSEVNQLKFKSNREGIKLKIYFTPYP